MDDKTLIQKLQKGNTGALDALIRRYTPYVSACAYRVLGSLPREELEEAVADTFVALWRHAGDLDPERNLRPWLGTVAANKAKNRLCSYSPAAQLPEDAPAPVDLQRQTEERETQETLWHAVEALSEPERTLFLRYYYEGGEAEDHRRRPGDEPLHRQDKAAPGKAPSPGTITGKGRCGAWLTG